MTDDQPIPPAPQTEQDSDNNAAHPNDSSFPEVKIPPSHACYAITCKTKRDKWDIAKLVGEFIGLGFLIAYTLYTAGIYCANKKAAEAAKSAADTAHETLVRTQRPWVGLKGYYLPLALTPNIPMIAEYAQINSGHGPALSVGSRVAFGVREEQITEARAEELLAKAPPPNHYTLLPGADFRVGYADVTVNDSWLGRVNRGKAWLYYFGDATYLDEFKCSHTTRFCAVWDIKAKAFIHCDVFNDAN